MEDIEKDLQEGPKDSLEAPAPAETSAGAQAPAPVFLPYSFWERVGQVLFYLFLFAGAVYISAAVQGTLELQRLMGGKRDWLFYAQAVFEKADVGKLFLVLSVLCALKGFRIKANLLYRALFLLGLALVIYFGYVSLSEPGPFFNIIDIAMLGGFGAVVELPLKVALALLHLLAVVAALLLYVFVFRRAPRSRLTPT